MCMSCQCFKVSLYLSWKAKIAQVIYIHIYNTTSICDTSVCFAYLVYVLPPHSQLRDISMRAGRVPISVNFDILGVLKYCSRAKL